MIERAEARSAADAVLVARTSTTDAWNAAASPPTSSAGMRDAIVGRAAAGLDEATAHGRLEAAEAEVERLAEPGARQRRWRTAIPDGSRTDRAASHASAATWIAGPPGYGSPSIRPTLSKASPAASSTVRPSSR